MKWNKARRKPIIIEFREVKPNVEIHYNPDNALVEVERIETRKEFLYGFPTKDYIIKGIKGEIFLMKKNIFHENYDVIKD